MSRRDQIRMSPTEISSYFDEHDVLNVATMNPNGRPHLAPLWYVPRPPEDEAAVSVLDTWTYASSQKVANLRRLAQATVLVESGESYETLRGVSMETDVTIVDEYEETVRIGTELMRRYTTGGVQPPEEFVEHLRSQALKRVGLVFTPTKTISWDHSKLGGVY